MSKAEVDIWHREPDSVAEAAGVPVTGNGPWDFHRSLPFYEKTPVHSLPEIASQLGVKRVHVKDESERFGLGSFKSLGSGYALHAIRPELVRHGKKVVAASAGNHGIGVAFFARHFGLDVRILIPAATPKAYEDRMSGFGAEVIRTGAGYDETVSLLHAYEPDYEVVSDTAWDGNTILPARIRVGYHTMFREVLEEIERTGTEDLLVLFQAGVGTFAASGIEFFRSVRSEFNTIRFGIVEPAAAACIKESATRGVLSTIPVGETKAHCLACGAPNPQEMPSLLAFPSYYASVSDAVASEGAEYLVSRGIGSSLNGAISIGLLLSLSNRSAIPEKGHGLGLTPQTTIVVFNTEKGTNI